MRAAGFNPPRIAVAGLNPHAGDGGNFGTEEIDVIEPAVVQAKAKGFAVEGPFPSDTVFLRAKNGDFDAVLTMYHDQGQIAMKLMGFDRGVTLIGGFPFPICTPAHGTAYEIAGRGIANLGASREALLAGDPHGHRSARPSVRGSARAAICRPSIPEQPRSAEPTPSVGNIKRRKERCLRRRHGWSATAMAVAFGGAAQADWKPTKPVEFVVTSAPGGGTDNFARVVQSIIAKHKLMDQAIVVTNKGGGSGAEGFIYAKVAPATPTSSPSARTTPIFCPTWQSSPTSPTS